MNPNVKIIVIAIVSAVVGGGLVVTGVKLASPAQPQAATQHVTVEPTDQSAAGEQPENAPAAAKAGTKATTKPGVNIGAGVNAGTGTGAAPATGGSNVDAQLRTLLTSSAWCSFSYNQYSGSSSSTRVTFSSNGTYSTGGQSESYSSGAYGTVSGQGNSSGGGSWKIQGSKLYMSSDETGGQLVDVGASLSQNSNGYPIITAGGVEYSQC